MKRRRTEDCCNGSFVSSSPRYVTRLYLRERRASGIESIGPYFGSLPPEMLNLLFSYLDAPALSSIGATCRVLDSYAKRMWKPLCVRLGLVHKPTVLCVANPLNEASVFSYDKAVELCRGDKCWEIMARRNWLYSKWRCVVCYRNCSHRVDVHFDVTLCDGCHPLFYRRKCHAKVREYQCHIRQWFVQLVWQFCCIIASHFTQNVICSFRKHIVYSHRRLCWFEPPARPSGNSSLA